MTAPKLTAAQTELLVARALTEGARVARTIFAKRGNHTEAHLSEVELSAILTVVFELGYTEGVPEPSLCPSCGALTETPISESPLRP
jgi:hypothetical protein